MIYKSITDLIGRTPLMELCAFEKEYGAKAKIIAKLECMNPAGSAKDRVAKAMIENAEKEGILKEGAVIIEPTSGNTGIGLASVGAARGYKTIIVMPDSMSQERRTLMTAYGAELVLTPGKEGMEGAVKKAQALAKEIPGSFLPGQFENLAGTIAHYRTTGPEIWTQTSGKVDIFVAGVGTGGTISGTARYLKEQNPNIRIVAVEPAGSPLLSAGWAGSHGIQGIGANFVPAVLDRSLIDEVVTVTDEEAFRTAKALNAKGIPAGISAGANVCTAAKFAKNGAYTVTILPDSADRYTSLGL